MNADSVIKQQAVQFARTHKKQLAKKLTNLTQYPTESNPVAVFMAGSPGAGKTEASLRLIEALSSAESNVLRIDSDELRTLLPGYTGSNSSLFQSATSIIADKMQDYAIKQHQNYVFDGTLTNEKRAKENISRCLKHGYAVYIIYVYQDPVQAWSFVQARQLKDGRVVPKQVFVDQYFRARESVNRLKHDFGGKVELHLIVKDLDGADLKYKANTHSIDTHVVETYTRDTLLEKLD